MIQSVADVSSSAPQAAKKQTKKTANPEFKNATLIPESLWPDSADQLFLLLFFY